MVLTLRPAADCRFDCAALGEVMLRFDPGEGRIRGARSFQVWEGGGEYNVARALSRVFGLRSTVLTALPDNELGALARGLIGAGGVDESQIVWRPFDCLGRATRLGLNFTERGFGVRAALGVSDRGATAASQMKPGDVDWGDLFGRQGVRWLHTGGVFAALSDQTAELTLEAMQAARAHGTIVSYDMNYRASLWQGRGGKAAAQALNRRIAPHVDLLIGSGFDEASPTDLEGLRAALGQTLADHPNIKVACATQRQVRSASLNDWTTLLATGGKVYESAPRSLDILDRVGSGDAFAAGVIFALIQGRDPQAAVELGAAHGALVMTTPGDSSMASLYEVEALAGGGSAGVVR